MVNADDAIAGLAPSIVPLPFGSGYDARYCGAGCHAEAFNCAAPFRERL